MDVLASVTRPDEWDLPLFLHVLGALTMMGALVLAGTYLVGAWRSGEATSLRYGLRTLLIGFLPAYIVFRVGAEILADKEGYADLDDPPDWIDIGYMVSDVGLLLLIISSLLGWRALRRTRKGESGPFVSARFAAGLVLLVLALNLVALWAMTTKPG